MCSPPIVSQSKQNQEKSFIKPLPEPDLSRLHHHAFRSRFSRRARGVATVEFAIVCSLFFLLVFMIIDFALYGFVKLTMQHAVREGARYAITGQVDLDPDANGNRKRAVIQKIKDNSMGFFDEVMTESDIVVTNSNGTAVAGFGAPGESIVITLTCQWPITNPFTQTIMSASHYNFSVAASVRNEAFPGAGP